MALVNVDTKGAVDEAAKVLMPEIEPILEAFATKIIEGLKGIVIGREITFTITIK